MATVVIDVIELGPSIFRIAQREICTPAQIENGAIPKGIVIAAVEVTDGELKVWRYAAYLEPPPTILQTAKMIAQIREERANADQGGNF